MLNHMKKHAVQSFVAFESPVGHPAWPILRVAQATNAPIATKRWARSPNSMPLKPTFADSRFATRLNRSRPFVEAMRLVFEEQPPLVAGRSTIAEAIRYALSRWTP
jgi:transposase